MPTNSNIPESSVSSRKSCRKFMMFTSLLYFTEPFSLKSGWHFSRMKAASTYKKQKMKIYLCISSTNNKLIGTIKTKVYTLSSSPGTNSGRQRSGYVFKTSSRSYSCRPFRIWSSMGTTLMVECRTRALKQKVSNKHKCSV